MNNFADGRLSAGEGPNKQFERDQLLPARIGQRLRFFARIGVRIAARA
jgi:hypothetical protein